MILQAIGVVIAYVLTTMNANLMRYARIENVLKMKVFRGFVILATLKHQKWLVQEMRVRLNLL